MSEGGPWDSWVRAPQRAVSGSPARQNAFPRASQRQASGSVASLDLSELGCTLQTMPAGDCIFSKNSLLAISIGTWRFWEFCPKAPSFLFGNGSGFPKKKSCWNLLILNLTDFFRKSRMFNVAEFAEICINLRNLNYNSLYCKTDLCIIKTDLMKTL